MRSALSTITPRIVGLTRQGGQGSTRGNKLHAGFMTWCLRLIGVNIEIGIVVGLFNRSLGP